MIKRFEIKNHRLEKCKSYCSLIWHCNLLVCSARIRFTIHLLWSWIQAAILGPKIGQDTHATSRSGSWHIHVQVSEGLQGDLQFCSQTVLARPVKTIITLNKAFKNQFTNQLYKRQQNYTRVVEFIEWDNTCTQSRLCVMARIAIGGRFRIRWSVPFSFSTTTPAGAALPGWLAHRFTGILRTSGRRWSCTKSNVAVVRVRPTQLRYLRSRA